MAHCFLATMWIVMASCLALLVTAGTQSDNAAHAISSDSCAHKITQPQQRQQQQPQPILQLQQRQLSSNLAPDLNAFLDKINFPSRLPLSNTKEFSQQTLDIDPVSKLSDANEFNHDYELYLNNAKTSDLLHANTGDTEPNTNANREPINVKSIFTPSNEPLLSQFIPDDEFTEISGRAVPYFLGKRKMYSFNNDDMPMSEDKKSVPMFVGKRGQSNGFNSEHFFPYNHISDLTLWKGLDFPATGYMSEAQKMAKGRMINGSILNLSDKRGPPRFVGKRHSVFEADSDGGSLLEHKRGAPRFVGKRGSVLESFTDGRSLLGHKRGAPRFVGKRGVPFFVGKRLLSESYGPDLASLDYSADELMNLEDKIKQLRHAGFDVSSYSSSKRGAPRFVGKRLAGSANSGEGYFGEKRDGAQGSHKSIKPHQAYKIPDRDVEVIAPVSDDNSNPSADNPENVYVGIKPATYKQSQDLDEHIYTLATGNGKGTVHVVKAATTEPRSASTGHPLSKRFSEFVGKRDNLADESIDTNTEAGKLDQEKTEDLLPVVFSVLPVDEDADQQDALDKQDYDFVGKRSPYDFVGKRSPYDFVGKRSPYDFVGKRSPYDFVGKRSAYDFVGKRSPYDFVGKRSPYDFVGKRSPYDFVGKRSAYDFVGKRSAYDFVGKRSPYDFVGKRSPYDFVGKRSPYDFVGKRSPYDFVGKRSPYDFVGKRSPYDFVGKRSPYDFVGKRSPYDFVGKRSPYDFVGKRSPYDFVGKRSPYDFVGKRSPYDFVGKRSPYDFVGKRSSYEFVGKRLPYESGSKSDQHRDGLENSHTLNLFPSVSEYMKEVLINHTPHQKSESTSKAGDAEKRYTEFLGKKKRTEEQAETIPSDSHLFAELLQSNGFRKRLSKFLLNQKLADQYPEFIGKRSETKDE